jgi:hypothetical protein
MEKYSMDGVDRLIEKKLRESTKAADRPAADKLQWQVAATHMPNKKPANLVARGRSPKRGSFGGDPELADNGNPSSCLSVANVTQCHAERVFKMLLQPRASNKMTRSGSE